MVWLWLGVGAVIGMATLVAYLWLVATNCRAAARGHQAVRDHQYAAEAAMVRAVQDTVAQLFDSVRRKP